MVEESSENNAQTSKYHSAKFILERINEVWKDARRSREQGDLTNWNWILDSAWLELCDDADEKKDVPKFLEFQAEVVANKEDKAKFYQTLLQKEQFLRKLQKTQGKSNKYQDEDEDDID